MGARLPGRLRGPRGGRAQAGQDLHEDVTAFALRRAAAYGFEARAEDFGGRLCSEARLVAGVR
ncbi:hypothetical protein [Variovorax sp. E3]|uniref:hypothetical protein n=1 Tax=Variovorax sp. E3 TaxID=1914993 RepID=UPI0018DCDFDA|nr:hypothetical protein [Variovorax sp. E3]